ncbi:AAA family ATPase [Paraburkholderia panacisoli]|uniref:AAA family ATPase n=1 Tax=Paraburkholderia panacisoli TaxID=2603818 RepID=A0A5B0GTH7_9BURK|nr:AAA family ATPase [Paraburkholderia panacisoli]KAA1006226.1 AAA family ATPase [Paraburkholderia panacisoli]
MSEVHLIRVSSIRSDNPHGFGGCIFYGPEIDSTGDVLDAKEHFVVKAPGSALGAVAVEIGQWWRVLGDAQPRVRDINGYRVTEQQVNAEALELVLPSGEHLVSLFAENDAFHGIGVVKARRLWETFGERLYSILDEGDMSTLTTVVSHDSAESLLSGWRQFGDTRTLHWLHTQGIDVALGKRLLAFFGAQTPQAIESDPYRLLSFCASWSTTDQLARGQFNVADDDPRRLQGAIEEALYRLFADGHTAATRAMAMTRLSSVLFDDESESPWRSLATAALDSGLVNGSHVQVDDLIQPLGAYVMETAVASAFASRLRQDELDGHFLLDQKDIENIVESYEEAEQISLNDEQRNAIRAAASRRLVVITGGAGVGKTTVLKALRKMYDRAGLLVVQAALSGRAAKHMQEATGKPSRTLATLLKSSSPAQFEEPCVMVVDEASMVDIITMYGLCTLLPSHVRLVLVGDPLQLMPVGPGLVLHAVVDEPRIPRIHLKVAKRFGSEIAFAAAAIREGDWPAMPEDETAPVAFIRHRPLRDASRYAEDPLAETVLRLYRLAPDCSQILSPRKAGPTGVNALNALCQTTLAADAQKLIVRSEEFQCQIDTGLRLGDPVVCTRNLWDTGLQNGSLGRLTGVEREPRAVFDRNGNLAGHAIAWIEWDDGEIRPVFESLLDDLQLAYALTVHKAQGSQWERIIIPVTRHRLLDRTLLYTALTRARRQVILVGDEDAARRAVLSAPRANSRNTGLAANLARALA